MGIVTRHPRSFLQWLKRQDMKIVGVSVTLSPGFIQRHEIRKATKLLSDMSVPKCRSLGPVLGGQWLKRIAEC